MNSWEDDPTEFEGENPNMTIDGFELEQEVRDGFSYDSENDLREGIVVRLVELALRAGTTAVAEVIGCMNGCIQMAKVVPSQVNPSEEEIMVYATSQGLLTDLFGRVFPSENAIMLAPSCSPEGDLRSLNVTAFGKSALCLWKHARAAHDELHHIAGPGREVLNTGALCYGKPIESLEDPADVQAHLDQKAGYYGLNLDDLPLTEEPT